MDNDEDPAEAAARLELALERIADLARKRPAAVANPGESVDTTAVAERLDVLIVRLRGVLEA